MIKKVSFLFTRFKPDQVREILIIIKKANLLQQKLPTNNLEFMLNKNISQLDICTFHKINERNDRSPYVPQHQSSNVPRLT